LLFAGVAGIIFEKNKSPKGIMEERIQKLISAAGITSRRAAERLIEEGRVRVNGKVAELGAKADASRDHIKVDGKLINPKQPLTYVMLNKPSGVVTTMSDPERRPTVQDLLKGIKARVYPVGRLDYNTEGMLLLTNDGDFAHLITHPKHELPKTYLAKLKGVLEDKQIQELESGVFLEDGKTAPARLKKVRKEEANSWVEITIHEGRKRQVRRMFDRVGRSVIKLKRIRTGNLALGALPEGTYRYLTPAEVLGLVEMARNPGMPVNDVVRPAAAVQARKPEITPPSPSRSGSRRPHERTSRPVSRTSFGGSVKKSAAGRPSAGAASGKTEAGKKTAQGTRPKARSGEPRKSGFAGGPRGEGRRPGSGPRPNRSVRTGGKGPGRGTKFGGRGAGRKK
jgi:23S rRNA pseudouridine2605 synthase